MSGFGVNGWQTPSTFAANRFQAHLAGDATGSDQFNLTPAIGQHENELRQLSGGWVSQVHGADGAKGDAGSATQAGSSGEGEQQVREHKHSFGEGITPMGVVGVDTAAEVVADTVKDLMKNGVSVETVGAAVLGATVGKRIPNVVPDNKQHVQQTDDKTSANHEEPSQGVELSASKKRAIKGLEDQIEAHQQKLKAYKENPDAFDNKGFLKDAPPDVRERIINSRIRSLENQIDTFTKDIEAIKSGSKSVLEKSK